MDDNEWQRAVERLPQETPAAAAVDAAVPLPAAPPVTTEQQTRDSTTPSSSSIIGTLPINSTAAEQDASGLTAVQERIIQDMVAPPAVNPDSLLFKARFQPGELLTSAAVAVKQAVDVGLAAIDCMYGPFEAAVQKQQLQQALAEEAAAEARAAALQRASTASKVSGAAAELNAAARAVSAVVDLNAAAGT
jgi:hypothetical protein